MFSSLNLIGTTSKMSLQHFAACLSLSKLRQKCPESTSGPASKLQKPPMPTNAYSMLIYQSPWCHHNNHITNKFSSHITFLVESKHLVMVSGCRCGWSTFPMCFLLLFLFITWDFYNFFFFLAWGFLSICLGCKWSFRAIF